ncbi:MAG: hypothetical protein D6784_05290 [Chloroflexi bacterium]|nr:MAG: hypothetical protein D6784_05290 [Chloroflexota bacterium]
MEIGLLWYDPQLPSALPEHLDRAARRFEARFGRKPTVCYVNQVDLDGTAEQIHGIHLKAVPDILPHHLWLGVE